MSIADYNRKLCIKGSSESSPVIIKQTDKLVTIALPLWQLNLIDAIIEDLDNESGCQVWYGYMKD